MIFSLQTLIWLGLVGITIFIPPVGGLGLLFGYALGDKAFALVNLGDLIRLPLFITEPVLMLLLVRAVIISKREQRFIEWELQMRSPWLWFYCVGLLNILFGLLFNGPLFVLRDAVIVFYGFIAQITVVYVRTTHHIRTIFFVVLGGLVLRLILGFFNPFFDHESSTFGMYSAFIIIGCFCTLPLWGRFKPLAVGVLMLFVAIMTATEIRTVWLGFFIAYLFIIGSQFVFRVSLKHLVVGSSAIFLSILFTISFLKFNRPHQYKDVRGEFFSMFAGGDSPNLMTRLAMWEDAVEAVVPSANILFDIFDRKVLNPHYFGSQNRPVETEMEGLARENRRLFMSKEPSATEILTQYQNQKPAGYLPVTSIPSNESEGSAGSSAGNSFKKRIKSQIETNKTLRTLFGVPFGHRFIPGRISAWHHVDRYDPHNSFIAIVYRTGLVGFSLFLLIIGRAFWKAFKALRGEGALENKYILLSIISCLVYHMGHSLTDVTFENPFRGAPFWLLLGLAMVFTSVTNKKESI